MKRISTMFLLAFALILFFSITPCRADDSAQAVPGKEKVLCTGTTIGAGQSYSGTTMNLGTIRDGNFTMELYISGSGAAEVSSLLSITGDSGTYTTAYGSTPDATGLTAGHHIIPMAVDFTQYWRPMIEEVSGSDAIDITATIWRR